MGDHSIAGPREHKPSTLTLIPTGNLESPINLTCMLLDSKRKLKYVEKTHTSTGRIPYVNSTQKGPCGSSNLDPSCCEALIYI